MNGDRMFQMAQALADAKSRQDLPAAMQLFASCMVLEVPAFGVTARGLAQNEKALARFFKAFPDYAITLQGHACDGRTLVCWGTARMTMTGDGFGVTPNGRRAELPVFIQFSFMDGLIAGERFFFDLSELCAQSGVSADVVRQKLFRVAPDAPVADQQKAALTFRRLS
jgi:predicted ester cyclase